MVENTKKIPFNKNVVGNLETDAQWKQAEILVKQSNLPKDQETPLLKAIENRDQKKFDSLLEQYGIKAQFYQMLDQLMKSQQEMKVRGEKAGSAAEEMFSNLPQPLMGGDTDSKAYTENLENATKSGEDKA